MGGEEGNPRRNFKLDLEKVCKAFDIEVADFKDYPPQKFDSYDDQNFRVFGPPDPANHGKQKSYMVKACHGTLVSIDHKRFQCAALEHLAASGVPVPRAIPLKSDINRAMDLADGGVANKHVYRDKQNNALVHVEQFIDGSELYPADTPRSEQFCEYIGKIVRDVHNATSDFLVDPELPGNMKEKGSIEETESSKKWRETATFTWDWSASEIVTQVSKRLDFVKSADDRKKVQSLLDRVSEVMPLTPDKVQALIEDDVSTMQAAAVYLQRGFAHTDVNDTNILFNQIERTPGKEAYEYCGLIDFGDCCFDYRLYDLGIAAGYACMHQSIDVLDTIGAVIRGYVTTARNGLPMPRACVRVVYAVALGRKLLSYIMGAEQMVHYPEDEYIAHTVKPTWDAARRHLTYSSMNEALDALMQRVNRPSQLESE